MTESEKCDTWTTCPKPDPLMGTCPVVTTRSAVSGLLEDSGNCRQYIDSEQSLYLLRESLHSEQQKLRDVLKWAEGFLRGPPDACKEFCTIEYFTLARVKQREKEQIPPAYKMSLGAKYQQQICPTASIDKTHVTVDDSEVYQPSSPNKSKDKDYKPLFRHDPLLPSSCSLVEDEETLLESRETENMKSIRLQQTNNKQTLCQVNCSAKRPHVSNQRHHEETSDCCTVQTLASDSATHFFKEPSAVFGAVSTSQALYDSNDFIDMPHKAVGVYSQKKSSVNQQEPWEELEGMDNSEDIKLNCKQKEKLKQMQKYQESGLDYAIYTYDEISNSEKETIPEWRSRTTNLSFTPNMKLSSHLTVYEQYKMCVDQLHLSRLNQHCKPRNLTQSVQKPSASATLQMNCHVTNPENKTHSDDIGNGAAESTEEKESHLPSEDLDSSQHTKYQATSFANITTESCETDTINEGSAGTKAQGGQMNLKKSDDLSKEPTDDSISCDAIITWPDETLWRQPEEFDTSAFTTKPGCLLKNKSPPLISRQRDVIAPRRTRDRVWRRLCEDSRSILTDRLLKSSNQNTIKYSKKLTSDKCTKTPDSRVKHTSSDSGTHRSQQTTETHTLQQEATLPAEGAAECVSVKSNGCENKPGGAHVSGCWTCLPDEVWLSVLSLVPHGDLCRVRQVCHRLHTLANDHTLWRNLMIENASLSDQWFVCVGRRRPHTLCLSSCSGPSVSSSGLQQFFSLCRNSLQELKVTSCVGAGLHGDQVLTLIGQLCENVTCVDVSWSGATDSGLKALTDSNKRLTLRAIVLNGCKITDVPLKKLIMKHHESLCRLEVFGCHSLSPSCLQTIYKTCPGLQHLNIGRVPKVNIHSLTLMSQLKCLISLNLSGLQAINDASVDSFLQNCVKLQCLTLSSCPAITDLTLHNISKHTACIRSLGLSGCAAVTDAGIQSLALGCRRLQQLDLSSTHTGNRGVSLLANYCSSHLHTVKLSFCHITSDIILKLCRNCRRLKVLHLYGCLHPPTGGQISNVNSTVKVYPPD